MTQAFLAIAWNGFREARRNRVTIVVAIFALCLVLFASLATEVTVVTFERTLTDVGLGSMSIILIFLAIFLSSGLLGREIERRTIFLIVSKPVSRGLFLVSRLAGSMLTLVVLLFAMSAVFCLETLLLGMPLTGPKILALGMLGAELLLLTCVGFFFSSILSQTVSAISTTGLYFVGHLSSDIYNLATRSTNPPVRWIGKFIYYLLPNLERVNFRPQATYAIATSPRDVLGALAYSIIYSALITTLAVTIFDRRDFK